MRVDWEVGIYPEHFNRILKWYNLAFKDKHPTREDEEVFNLISLLFNDLKRQAEEDKIDE